MNEASQIVARKMKQMDEDSESDYSGEESDEAYELSKPKNKLSMNQMKKHESERYSNKVPLDLDKKKSKES